jgi:hypothetical protein
MWVDFIDICQFQIYQDFRMGLARGIGALLLGGRLELIGIGSFLMVEYHKSSAAYANQLKPLCSEDFWRCAYPAQNVPNTTKLVRWLEGADDLWYSTMRKPPQAISPTSIRRKVPAYQDHSTVTLLAKLRGLSTSVPLAQAV